MAGACENLCLARQMKTLCLTSDSSNKSPVIVLKLDSIIIVRCLAVLTILPRVSSVSAISSASQRLAQKRRVSLYAADSCALCVQIS